MFYRTAQVNPFQFSHYLDSFAEELDPEEVLPAFVNRDRDALLRHYIPMAKREASIVHRGSKVQLDDLVQAALLGLIEAFDEFPNIEVRELEPFIRSRMRRVMKRLYYREVVNRPNHLHTEPGIADYRVGETIEDLKLDCRESKVLRLLLQQYSRPEIAGALGVTEARISQIVKSIRGKYEYSCSL